MLEVKITDWAHTTKMFTEGTVKEFADNFVEIFKGIKKTDIKYISPTKSVFKIYDDEGREEILISAKEIQFITINKFMNLVKNKI